VQGFSGDGGPAASAQITRPFGLAFDRDQNLYFTDTEVNRIRRVDAVSGTITTVAGNGSYGFSGDAGPATAATLARPHVLTFDPDGNLVIGDSFNQRIRRVDRRTGVIATIAGSGYRGNSGDDGPATQATFVYFGGIAYDTAGDLLVSGVGDHRIRRIERGTGIIRAFAGSGSRCAQQCVCRRCLWRPHTQDRRANGHCHYDCRQPAARATARSLSRAFRLDGGGASTRRPRCAGRCRHGSSFG
jgi:hypothetical protein